MTEVQGNLIQDYLMAVLLMLVIFVGLAVLFRVFKKALRNVAEKRPDKQFFLLKILEALSWPLFLVIGLSISSVTLYRTEILSKIVEYILTVFVIIYSTKILIKIINYLAKKIIKRNKYKKDAKDASIIELYAKLLSILAWIVAIVMLLIFFEVNLTAIFAGIGVASIAIAFALQNVLSDGFATISIYFDRPFTKGDFIVIGADSGTVEKIGIKSTRIKTLNGEELIMSNRELTESRVRNFKHMQKRRAKLNVKVQYDTPIEKLQKIPKIIEKIIGKIEKAELSRSHFKSFQDSAMEFEAIYFIKSKEYKLYMDIQQKINFDVIKALRKEGIQLAFPTRTLHMVEENKRKTRKK